MLWLQKDLIQQSHSLRPTYLFESFLAGLAGKLSGFKLQMLDEWNAPQFFVVTKQIDKVTLVCTEGSLSAKAFKDMIYILMCTAKKGRMLCCILSIDLDCPGFEASIFRRTKTRRPAGWVNSKTTRRTVKI